MFTYPEALANASGITFISGGSCLRPMSITAKGLSTGLGTREISSKEEDNDADDQDVEFVAVLDSGPADFFLREEQGRNDR